MTNTELLEGLAREIAGVMLFRHGEFAPHETGQGSRAIAQAALQYLQQHVAPVVEALKAHHEYAIKFHAGYVNNTYPIAKGRFLYEDTKRALASIRPILRGETKGGSE